MSLLGTATGRVFAAFLPAKLIETFLEAGQREATVGDEAASICHASRSKQHWRRCGKRVWREPSAVRFRASMPSVSRYSTIGLFRARDHRNWARGTFDADWESPIATKLLECAAKVSERLGSPSNRSHQAA